MKLITGDMMISIVGVGGLGSIIAETLVRNGFNNINLIDNDIIEVTNLNRVVGAYYKHINKDVKKVDAIKEHLLKINPNSKINAFPCDVHDIEMEQILGLSDWIFLATDNHSSRYKTQDISLKYFVPLISAGVNITVSDNSIVDMSGEIITARIGDNLCLNCLGRINQTKVAFDLSDNKDIKEKLVDRGYVEGRNVKQPAVMTLNSIVSNIAVETLLNQITERQKHRPIVVFENNETLSVFEDKDSLFYRNTNCYYCNI